MRQTLLVLGVSLSLCVSNLAAAAGAAGISWTAPSTWKEAAPRPMRAATYAVPATSGDSEDAELAVFYFGQGQGGSAEDNVRRWVGQFTQPDGKPSQQASKSNEKKVGAGLKATTVEVGGTYTGMGGPMATVKTEKPNYKLLGAIVDAPGGAVFFKLTGPAKTVEASRKAFDKLLSSIKKD